MPGNEKDIEQHSLLKSVILHLLPGSYIIQWKKNIYLGIIPHCLLNTTGMLLLAPLVFS